MNREQRRKSGVKTKEPVLNIRACDIKRMKDEAALEASKAAFIYTIAIPILVMRDKFGFGKTRLERMTDEIIKLWESYGAGLLTVEDMQEVIKQETGLEITELVKR